MPAFWKRTELTHGLVDSADREAPSSHGGVLFACLPETGGRRRKKDG